MAPASLTRQACLLQELICPGHFLFEKRGIGHRVELLAYPNLGSFGASFFSYALGFSAHAKKVKDCILLQKPNNKEHACQIDHVAGFSLFLFKYSLNSANVIFPVSLAIFSLISLNTFTVSKDLSFLIFVFIVHNFFG